MITSERLRYSKWTEQDFRDLKRILGNPEVCRYLPGDNHKSDEEIRRWLNQYSSTFMDERGTSIYKVSTTDDIVVGYGGLSYVKEFDKMEIMYGLAEDSWNQGYGTEISMRMKELAQERGLKELIALADVRNPGSNKILLRTGFERIKQIHLWGLDLHYYEMTL